MGSRPAFFRILSLLVLKTSLFPSLTAVKSEVIRAGSDMSKLRATTLLKGGGFYAE